MEEDRKGKPAAVFGGMYAKAKQRVLNKMGKRTSELQKKNKIVGRISFYRR